jgi:hypothetical protein
MITQSAIQRYVDARAPQPVSVRLIEGEDLLIFYSASPCRSVDVRIFSFDLAKSQSDFADLYVKPALAALFQ